MKIFIQVVLAVVLMACQQQEIVPAAASEKRLSLDDKRVVILLAGKQITNEELQAIDPNTIESIEVIKDKAQIKKYSADDVAGIVKINLKKSKR